MVTKKIILLIAIVFSMNAFAQADAVKSNSEFDQEVELIVGLERILSFDFNMPQQNGIKIANESLVTYQFVPQKKQVLLTGIKPGETSLTVRDYMGDIKKRFLLKITSSDQSKVLMQLKELLGDIEGLEIGLKGDTVFVGGQIVVPSDIGRVVVILDKYPDVLRLVELSPQTQIVIAKRMQDEIQNANFKDVTVRVVNGTFWVEGIVDSEGAQKRVEEIVTAYLPDQIQNLARRTEAVEFVRKKPYQLLLTINTKPAPMEQVKMFKITTQFVELTKTYDKTFGFSWNPVIGNNGGTIQIGKSNGGVTTNSQGTLAATISNLFPKLNSAKSAGYARVIQSAVIVTKDREQGEIQRMTDIPFVMGSGEYQKTETSKAGMNIKVIPSSMQEENVNLQITVNVSASIPQKTNSGETAQTMNNTVTTQLIVKSKESAVIGGVVANKYVTNFDQDPPDSEAVENGSYLFTFMRSKKQSTNRSQFVIFVTPELVESASTASKDIEKKFRKRGR